MYLEYWGLKELPFDNTADPRFFFESGGHLEAITRILFGVQTRKTIVLLTGDYGTGKTLVCETVLGRLPANEYKVAFISNPRMESIDLTREIAFQIGEDISSRLTYDVLHAFNDVLARHASTGRHCVAFFDESQNIFNASVLEDLRLLLNHQVGGRPPLTLVFAGQTEFGDMMKSIPQMMQRVGLKYHIPNLQADEVRHYIAFRLKVAGNDGGIFDDAGVGEIGKLSKGNPREVNALCDLCLLIGSLTGKKRIGVEEVLDASRERA